MSLTPPDQDLVGIINQIEKDLDEVQFYISGQTTGSGGGISVESTSVPSGGTTGQALVKTSNVDGEVAWATIDINTVSVGTTTTTASGTNASVTNSGTVDNLILDFAIPRGNKGDTGSQGPAGTITLGTVTTTASGTNAAVTNTGTASGAILNFSFPRGDKGDKGDTGNTGSQGPSGSITLGTVTTTASGTSASITNSGTSSAAVFDFSIPRGDRGNTILNGSGAPSSGIGGDGDFYLDTTAGVMYGPKTSGAWSSTTFVSTPGPAGSPGAAGPAGPAGPAGATDARMFFLR